MHICLLTYLFIQFFKKHNKPLDWNCQNINIKTRNNGFETNWKCSHAQDLYMYVLQKKSQKCIGIIITSWSCQCAGFSCEIFRITSSHLILCACKWAHCWHVLMMPCKTPDTLSGPRSAILTASQEIYNLGETSWTNTPSATYFTLADPQR